MSEKTNSCVILLQLVEMLKSVGKKPNSARYCFKLADQLRSWYEMESSSAMIQVYPISAADARALKILQETTYHDGCRYQFGMLWADDESSLPNYFSALVQLKSLELRLEKTPELKMSNAQTIKDDFDKGCIVQVDKSVL